MNPEKAVETDGWMYVDGINTVPETAEKNMMSVKLRYGKEDGIMAYHVIQAFAPGEVTPEVAHEIGMKLAERMWGDRFEVIVSTHLDHEHMYCLRLQDLQMHTIRPPCLFRINRYHPHLLVLLM